MSCVDCGSNFTGLRKRCEPCLEKARQAQREFTERQGPDYVRARNLKRKFGMTIEDYEALLAEQGGVCAICGAASTYYKSERNYRLSVDHDHETGKVRGLLCNPCNRALGFFRDDAKVIAHAVEYLEGRI